MIVNVTVAIDILFLLNMPFFVYKMYFLFRSDMKSKLIFLSARPAPHLVLIVHCTMYTTCTSKSRSMKNPRYVFNPTAIRIFFLEFPALIVIFCLKEVKFVVGHTGCVRYWYFPAGVLFYALQSRI